MDLFNQTPPTDYDYEQDALREAMLELWEADKAIVSQRRFIPDWIGEPEPLSKDRAALLEYLYENGSLVWPKTPGPDRVKAAKILGYVERADKNTSSLDLGIEAATIAVANARAIIDACLSDGLIEARLHRGQEIMQLTQEGEYALEDYMLERELGYIDT